MAADGANGTLLEMLRSIARKIRIPFYLPPALNDDSKIPVIGRQIFYRTRGLPCPFRMQGGSGFLPPSAALPHECLRPVLICIHLQTSKALSVNTASA